MHGRVMVTTHVDRSAKTTYFRMATSGLIAMRATGLPDRLAALGGMTQTPVTHHLPARRHAYHPHPYDSCRRTCTASRPRLTAVTRAPFITVLVRRPSLARG